MSKMKNILKGIIAITILLSIFFGYSSVRAEGETDPYPSDTWDTAEPTERMAKGGTTTRDAWYDNANKMPSEVSGATGLMPQYYRPDGYEIKDEYKRTVHFERTRLDLETNQWVAKVDGKVVYCALLGGAVKYGFVDKDIHYFRETGMVIQGKAIKGLEWTESDTTLEELADEKKDDVVAYLKTSIRNENKPSDLWEDDMRNLSWGNVSISYSNYDLPSDLAGYYNDIGYDEDGLAFDLGVLRNENKTVIKDASPGMISQIPLMRAMAFGDMYKKQIFKAMGEYTKPKPSPAPAEGQEWDRTVEGDYVWSEADAENYGPAVTVLQSLEAIVQEDTDDGPVETDRIYDKGYHEVTEENQVFSSTVGTEDGEVLEADSSETTAVDDIDRKIEIEKSFVLTALEDSYAFDGEKYVISATVTNELGESEERELAGKYTLNDIQYAYWLVLWEEGQLKANRDGTINSVKDPRTIARKVAPNGETLWKKSQEYAKFVMNNLDAYNTYSESTTIIRNEPSTDSNVVSVDGSMINVIADATNKQYYIGPIKIDYGYIQDVVYIKSMTLKTNKGKELVLSEDRNDGMEIVFDNTSNFYAGDSNGIHAKFPASGQFFYIKLDAEKNDYPTGVDLSVQFEYLAKSEIEYKVLETDADVYRYVGHTHPDLDYNWKEGLIAYTLDYDYYYGEEYWLGTWTQHSPSCESQTGGTNCTCSGPYKDMDKRKSSDTKHGSLTFYYGYAQPFIRMTRNPVDSDTPQEFTLTDTGERTYKTFDVSVYTKPYPEKTEYEGKYTYGNGGKGWYYDTDSYDTTVITVYLLRNGVPTGDSRQVSKATDWRYSFGELDKYDENGNLYVYSVTDNGEGFSPRSMGVDLINDKPEQEYISKKINKIWDDDNESKNTASAVVKLMCRYRDGTVSQVGEAQKIKNEKNLTVEWKDLPKYEIYTENGIDKKFELEYFIEEEEVPGFIPALNGEDLINTYGRIDLTVSLGGYVWEDIESGKETIANGEFDNTERRMKDITVRIYRTDGGDLKNGKKYMETKTDSSGEYEFQGLDPMFKYYIKFYYNGLYYEPTTMHSCQGKPEDNPYAWGGTKWKITSNAKEDVKPETTRQTLNNRFAVIGAAPNNYANGQTYTKSQLINKDVIDFSGNLQENAVNSTDAEVQKMVKFVQNCKIDATTEDVYPYSSVIPQVFEKNQYSYMELIFYSGTPLTLEQKLSINKLRNIIKQEAGAEINYIVGENKDGPGYFINLGLHPRKETDLKLEKDIEKVTIEINGQTEDYKYGELTQWRCEDCGDTYEESDLIYDFDENFLPGFYCPKCIAKKDENPLAGKHLVESSDMRIRLRKSDDFYRPNYVREVYPSDYEYQVERPNGIVGDYGEHPEVYGKTEKDELAVYVTYKITVTNQLPMIYTRLDEIVDYYDKEYEFVPERSYIKLQESSMSDESGEFSLVSSTSSKTNSHTGKKFGDYNKVYISGMGKDGKNYYLKPDERLNIYLTFKVVKDDNGKIQLDEETDGKKNVAEITGYATKYGDGYTIANRGDVSGTPAGVLDSNSTPGNLDDNVWNEFLKWEADANRDMHKNILENDVNMAPDLILELSEGNDRVISGTVWEDERSVLTDTNASIGDGIMQDDETKINGVTVQLVELMENGTEYVWREFGSQYTGSESIGTGKGSGKVESELPIIDSEKVNIEPYTFEGNHDGMYAFKSFVPGRYVVRFIYGDTDKTIIDKPLAKDMNLNQDDYNAKSYNGQDYKSTVYQKGVNQNATYEQKNSDIWANANIDGNEENNRLTYLWRMRPETDEFVDGERVLTKIVSAIPTYRADAYNNENVQLWLPVNGSDAPNYLSTGNNLTDLVNGVNKETGTSNPQKGYLYDISESEKYNGLSEEYPNVSDAKDLWNRRAIVNNYSNENVTNKVAEILASHKSEYYEANEDIRSNIGNMLGELINETYMTAETGLMVIEVEYDNQYIEEAEALNDVEDRYQIKNVNLGLVERPNSQLLLNKEVKKVKLNLANGSTLFDASTTATNVLWKEQEEFKTKYDEFEGKIKSKQENIATINNERALGLIQLTMDEEIMHGANIILDYDITVRNIGEIDYKDPLFYYTGVENEPSENIVTTTANEIIDYVSNNLQFNAANNKEYWESISKDTLFEEDLVNERLKEKVQEFNTIIKIKDERISTELMPELYKSTNDAEAVDSITVPLILSQLITSENDTDDLTYINKAEIVKTSNTVGRRMEFSVVGNQDPKSDPAELDSAASQLVRILPPFGETTNYLLISIVAIISIGIVVVGIIFIKKKILK